MIARIDKLWLTILLACLIPLVWLIFDIAFDRLGANPTQALHIRLGDWTLRFLCLTLAITPVQTISKWRGMTTYRQMLGLYTFFYASLHLLSYLIIDHNLQWRIIGIDIIESSYIWLGILAYLIIFLLAISTPKWVRKYLGKNWKKLHRFIYLAAGAGILHYFWQLKGNLIEPIFYLIMIALLLGFRVLVWLGNRQLSKMMIPKSRE